MQRPKENFVEHALAGDLLLGFLKHVEDDPNGILRTLTGGRSKEEHMAFSLAMLKLSDGAEYRERLWKELLKDKTLAAKLQSARAEAWRHFQPAVELLAGIHRNNPEEYFRRVHELAFESARSELRKSSWPSDQELMTVVNSIKGKSGCFIATACYGAPDCSEVLELRGFRDECLLPKFIGRGFVACYYCLAPPIASVIANHWFLRTLVRCLFIRPIVWGVRFVRRAR